MQRFGKVAVVSMMDEPFEEGHEEDTHLVGSWEGFSAMRIFRGTCTAAVSCSNRQLNDGARDIGPSPILTKSALKLQNSRTN